MKKLICVLLCAWLLLSATSCHGNEVGGNLTTDPESTQPADAATTAPVIVDGDGLEFAENGDGTCTVVGMGTCTATHLRTPSKAPSASIVTAIKTRAFEGQKNLVYVELPDTLKTIGGYAFLKCQKLETVIIPEGVTEIGGSAFTQTALRSIHFPASATTIHSDCIRNIDTLMKITVAPGNEKYSAVNNCLIQNDRKWLIAGCNGSVIPTDGCVTIIHSEAFAVCNNLTSITIPSAITEVERDAFINCASLETVIFEGAPTLNQGIFGSCKALKNVVLPEGTKLIPFSMFNGCKAMVNIDLPSTIQTIENDCFLTCFELVTIHFAGTTEQWNKISKQSRWNSFCNEVKIICSDGELTVVGTGKKPA